MDSSVYSALSCLEHTIQRNESAVNLTDFLDARVLQVEKTLSSADEQKDERNSAFNTMLHKQRRVSTALFDEVMTKGKSFHSSHLTLRLLYKDGLDTSHFSVVVPKKVSIKAVVRNALRRRLYPIIRKFEARLTFSAVALIFIKTDISTVPHEELTEEVRMLLSRVFNQTI